MKQLLLVGMLVCSAAYAQQVHTVRATGIDKFFVYEAKHCSSSWLDTFAEEKADFKAEELCGSPVKRTSEYEITHKLTGNKLCQAIAVAIYKCVE